MITSQSVGKLYEMENVSRDQGLGKSGVVGEVIKDGHLSNCQKLLLIILPFWEIVCSELVPYGTVTNLEVVYTSVKIEE